MMKFKLCYEIKGYSGTYIAPQRLSFDKPYFDNEWPHKENLTVEYKYEFMPKGILIQLIIGLHRFIYRGADINNRTKDFVWRTGAIFNMNGTIAEVIEYYPDKRMTLKVGGYYPERLLAIIMHEIDKIHASFYNLKYDRYVPCICNKCNNSNTPHLFPYEILSRSIKNDVGEVQCQKSFIMVSAKRLIRLQLPVKQLQQKRQEYLAENHLHFEIDSINYTFNDIEIDTVRGGIVDIGGKQNLSVDVDISLSE